MTWNTNGGEVVGVVAAATCNVDAVIDLDGWPAAAGADVSVPLEDGTAHPLRDGWIAAPTPRHRVPAHSGQVSGSWPRPGGSGGWSVASRALATASCRTWAARVGPCRWWTRPAGSTQSESVE